MCVGTYRVAQNGTIFVPLNVSNINRFSKLFHCQNNLWAFFVADFLQAKCDFRLKLAVLRFWAPFGGLRATYDDHLMLIEKRVVDFLLVLIELFSSCITAEVLRAKIYRKSAISLQRGPVNSKFQVKGVALHQPFFSQKTRLNDLSYGIKKIWADFSPVLSQFTRLTDRQTDGRRRTDGHVSRD